MSKVLVVVELGDGKLRSYSLPGITAGQQVAAAQGGELHLLLLGAAPQAAAEAIAQAGYGAKTVHVGALAELEPFSAEAWADAIVAAAKAIGVSAIGGTATSTLRDALPRAAALLGAGLAPEITAVKGPNTFGREIWAGRAIAEITVSGELFLFTARASEFKPAEPGGAAASVAAVAVTASARGTKVLSIEKTQSARPALGEAKVIVSGGRGMREGANFRALEELTDLLGGALGASRAATDAGMVPADLQVGQTGKVVAPNLYIAVAISGAIQHLAGMKGSKVIVAINKNAEEPIFQIADYGLVAKWEDAIPKLTELIRARKG
jgi:electron transfer flavoprotein alpha subunit